MPETVHILIVDEEQLLVDLLTRELRECNAVVSCALSAGQARELLHSVHPGLVLLNADIPGSFELLADIRATRDPIAVIGLTDSHEMPARLAAFGVETIRSKRGGLNALLSAIRRYLDLERSEDEERVEILVVEDDHDLRRVLAAMLDDWGYAAYTASSGDEAIWLVERRPALAVALLDVLLPGKGGLEILHELRAKSPDLGVIMLTAVADREVARRAIKLGAFDYFIKPPDFAALETGIIACLGHRDYLKRPWWKRFGDPAN